MPAASTPPARVVAVTGAASGIGAACARRFEAAGERVVLLDRDAERGAALAREKRSGFFLAVDVADPQAVRSAFEAIRARAGGLDVLAMRCAPDPPSPP